MRKTALITGVTGQDGAYLAKLLLEKKETTAVISIGRNKPKNKSFTLDVGKNDSRYEFKEAHIVFEKDILKEIIDEFDSPG